MANRTVSVELKMLAEQYKAEADLARQRTDALDNAVDRLDRDINKLPPDAAKAAASMGVLGEQSRKLGGETDKATTSLDKVRAAIRNTDEELARSKTAMQGLVDEFSRTGDLDIVKKFTGEQGNTNRLQKFRADLVDIRTELEKVSLLKSALDNVSGGLPAAGPLSASLTTGLAGVAPVVVPFIASVINAGVLLGLGGGALTLGIVGAVQDPRVKAAFSGLATDAKNGLAAVSSAFVEPLERAAQRFRSELTGNILPGLGRDFDVLAPSLDRLSQGVTGFAHNVMPGLNNAIQSSQQVLDTLAADLPRYGTATSAALDQISQGSKGAADGLSDFDLVVQVTIFQMGFFIGKLSQLYELTHKLPIGGVAQAVSEWLKRNDDLTSSFQLLNPKVDQAAIAARNAAYAGEQLAAAMKRVNDLTAAGISSAGSQAQANDRVAAGFQAVADAVNHGAHTLDIHSAAGRANREMILSQVDSLKQQREAAITAAGGVNASKEAVDRANAAYNAGVGQLGAMAQKLDSAGAKADDLAGALRSIPNIERSVTIDYLVRTTHKDLYIGGASPYTQSASALLGAGATGGIRSYASGGIDFSGGVLPPSAPGTILAGEPQTGGEAFIPRLGISDDRGLALADVAASWHGGRVLPGSAGKVVSGSGTGVAAVTNINLTVHAGMGANGAQLGQQIIDALRPYVASYGNNVQLAVAGRP